MMNELGIRDRASRTSARNDLIGSNGNKVGWQVNLMRSPVPSPVPNTMARKRLNKGRVD